MLTPLYRVLVSPLVQYVIFVKVQTSNLSSNIRQPGRLSIFGIFTGRNYGTENNRYSTSDAEGCRRKLH